MPFSTDDISLHEGYISVDVLHHFISFFKSLAAISMILFFSFSGSSVVGCITCTFSPRAWRGVCNVTGYYHPHKHRWVSCHPSRQVHVRTCIVQLGWGHSCQLTLDWRTESLPCTPCHFGCMPAWLLAICMEWRKI